MVSFAYTDRDYLEGELERYRQAERDRNDEEIRKHEQRERERKEEREFEMRSAGNWPEALRKQAILFRHEAAQWTDEDDPDDFFGPGAKACERALDIWKDISAEKQAASDELQAQIAKIEDSIRIETADRLKAESNDAGWTHVAVSLLIDQPGSWLDW